LFCDDVTDKNRKRIIDVDFTDGRAHWRIAATLASPG